MTLNNGGVLTIGTTTTTGTLNMGANSITLNGNGKISTVNATHAFLNILGGSITGTGTSSITGAGNIAGWGTISVPTANATWNANTAGQALTFQGGGTYGGTFSASTGGGSFNFNGVTLNSMSVANTSGGTFNFNNGTTLNSATFNGSGKTLNLNSATINGATFTNAGSGSQFYLLGDSTLEGAIAFNQYYTFNLGGSYGAHTLNLAGATLNTVTGGANPFIVGAGGVLNGASGSNSMGGGGSVVLQGGSITDTGGTFRIGDGITGYGLVSGPVNVATGATATGSGQTLTLDGGSGSPMQVGSSYGSGANLVASAGATLDVKGNISLIQPDFWAPGGGVIQMDGANITNGFASFHPLQPCHRQQLDPTDLRAVQGRERDEHVQQRRFLHRQRRHSRGRRTIEPGQRRRICWSER